MGIVVPISRDGPVVPDSKEIEFVNKSTLLFLSLYIIISYHLIFNKINAEL